MGLADTKKSVAEKAKFANDMAFKQTITKAIELARKLPELKAIKQLKACRRALRNKSVQLKQAVLIAKQCSEACAQAAALLQ